MKINLTRALAGTALVSALAVSAIATECKNFSGFYLGAQVGAGTTNTKTSGNLFFAPVAGGVSNKVSSKFAATGMLGGLHVGYGKQFPNHFYLGVEAYGNLTGNKETHSIQNGSSFRVERKNAFGGKLLIGYRIANVLPALVVGIESAAFKNAVTTYDVTAGPPPTLLSTANKSSRRTGLPVGVRVTFHATEHVLLGVEGTHTFYNARSLTPKTAAGVAAGRVKFESQATDITARVSYKW